MKVAMKGYPMTEFDAPAGMAFETAEGDRGETIIHKEGEEVDAQGRKKPKGKPRSIFDIFDAIF